MKTYKGIDCWKTWFIDECNSEHLFGVPYNQLHLIQQYEIGKRIYLEDRPFYSNTNIKKHRLCGPYRIVESTPEDPYEIKKEKNGRIVIYKDLNASRGPWGNNPPEVYDPPLTKIVKYIDRDIEVTYRQKGGDYGFYPYRFSIELVEDEDTEDVFVPHTAQCALCNEA